MNKFEKWFMNSIIRRQVRQGYNHSRNITELYRMIRTACENEFSEDNTATLNSFLLERFSETLK